MAAAGKGFLVCAYSSGGAESGLLKAKVRAGVCVWKRTRGTSAVCLLVDMFRYGQVEALAAYLSTSLDQINV